jgi:hypothetical protein
MANPLTYSITLHWHTTFRLVISIADTDGDPVNLTGATAYAKVGAFINGAEVEYVDLSPEITDATGGVITIETMIDEPAVGRRQWDLIVQHDDGTVDKYVQGVANIIATISDYE